MITRKKLEYTTADVCQGTNLTDEENEALTWPRSHSIKWQKLDLSPQNGSEKESRSWKLMSIQILSYFVS